MLRVAVATTSRVFVQLLTAVLPPSELNVQQAAARILKTSFPMKAGSVTVHSLGKIRCVVCVVCALLRTLCSWCVAARCVRYGPHDTSYCTEKYLYPVGYKSTREYSSYKHPGRRTVYTSTIVDGGTMHRSCCCSMAPRANVVPCLWLSW